MVPGSWTNPGFTDCLVFQRAAVDQFDHLRATDGLDHGTELQVRSHCQLTYQVKGFW